VSLPSSVREIIFGQENLRDSYIERAKHSLISVHQQSLANCGTGLANDQVIQASTRQTQTSGAKSDCAGRDQHNLAPGTLECDNRAHDRLNLFGGYLTVQAGNN